MDPKWRNVIVLGIVVVIVAAGIGVYVVHTQSSNGGGSSGTCSQPLASTNPIKVDQPELPDYLDPQQTFTTPGWAAVQQVYQGLVNYNGSSSTNFSGVLATNWTTSSDGLHWNFTLRSGVTFSNGDPYNAYVQWFSFYRSLLLNAGPQFILSQNFWYPGLNYYSNSTAIANEETNLSAFLNTTDFFAPTPGEIQVMAASNQSFQVLNANMIELNLGFGYLGQVPYNYLLPSISAPNSYAVDPAFVQQNGGVVPGVPNTYLDANTLGTGPYTLTAYNPIDGGGYTLVPSSHYWGTSAARAQPWNNAIQPANTTVQIVFSQTDTSTISDLLNGQAASASFAYTGPSTINQLTGDPCLVVQPLSTIYGATSGSWWVFMNQSVFPFNNLSVREAIVHSINYPQIIQDAFGGYGSQWVGPVPPSYPYYNPQSLPPYAYNLTLAQQEIRNSPCANNACAGTVFNYEYQTPGADWADATSILQSDLAQIGITIKPIGMSVSQLLSEQLVTNGVCTSSTTLNGGPFYIGQEFYTSDYISPDDWTQNDAISYGSANMCMSGYANATMDNLVLTAAGTSNPTLLNQYYTEMTNLMYNNYTNAWLVVPTAVAVYNVHVHGIIQNPMASAEPFAFFFNTQWAR